MRCRPTSTAAVRRRTSSWFPTYPPCRTCDPVGRSRGAPWSGVARSRSRHCGQRGNQRGIGQGQRAGAEGRGRGQGQRAGAGDGYGQGRVRGKVRGRGKVGGRASPLAPRPRYTALATPPSPAQEVCGDPRPLRLIDDVSAVLQQPLPQPQPRRKAHPPQPAQ
eukprot:scaffold104721_cov48-Phaeocystis_antarctica.AAC.1